MPFVRVSCPATSANLGPGLDALGLALNLRNTFEVEELAEGFAIEVAGLGSERIPRDPEQNLVVQAFQAARAELGLAPVAGLRLAITLGVPTCGGLGSSATASLAGVMAAGALARSPFGADAALALATRLEGHPDNVVPSFLGGVCAAAQTAGGGIAYSRAAPPNPPSLVLAAPAELQLSTPAMRAILPEQVPFADAVWNLGRVSLLAFALLQGEREPLATALDDRLHQPYRGALIPGFEAVREAAREAGALGTVISGSGPALLAFAPDDAAAEQVVPAMVQAWEGAGVPCTAQTVAIDPDGARAEYVG